MSAKESFTTNDAPAPVARYSQAVRKGSLVAIAGQIGVDPSTGQVVDGGVAEQTRQMLRNVTAVLAAAGATFDDVIMMRVYLTDASHLADMNGVYEEFVTEPYPGRTTVFVGLAAGALVEMDALAVVD